MYTEPQKEDFVFVIGDDLFSLFDFLIANVFYIP